MSNIRYSRTVQIVGEDNLFKLKDKKIIIFGVGGVGGQALESLVRSGFCHFTLVDKDVVEESNLNRQIIAVHNNLGEPKVIAAQKRVKTIDPYCIIQPRFAAVNAQNIDSFELNKYDFIIDAIDSFDDKIALIKYALRHNLPFISAMGAGNRLDPTKVIITKIEKTSGCPIAKKVRYELRQEKLKNLMVVTSSELPLPNFGIKPGSSAFVPAAYGLAIASYIFTNVINE